MQASNRRIDEFQKRTFSAVAARGTHRGVPFGKGKGANLAASGVTRPALRVWFVPARKADAPLGHLL